MSQFATIGLIGRKEHMEVEESLQVLVDYLSARNDVTVIIDEVTAGFVQENGWETSSPEYLAEHCDLVIVVGGDGSMLKVSPVMAEFETPVIGINRGTLGFMTDILPDEVEERIDQVLAGEYKTERRFLLDVSAEHHGEVVDLGCALNDVVIHPGVAAQMIEFELYIDDEYVYSQASDGLIVATPTGSTAYSMSAGGPIMHPGLDAVVLVPMYPHSLSSRPIVIGANSEITIVVGNRHNILPQVSCDGSVSHTTQPGDRIMIGKKTNPLNLIHPQDYNYYETCRSKLGWSFRPGRH